VFDSLAADLILNGVPCNAACLSAATWVASMSLFEEEQTVLESAIRPHLGRWPTALLRQAQAQRRAVEVTPPGAHGLKGPQCRASLDA